MALSRLAWLTLGAAPSAASSAGSVAAAAAAAHGSASSSSALLRAGMQRAGAAPVELCAQRLSTVAAQPAASASGMGSVLASSLVGRLLLRHAASSPTMTPQTLRSTQQPFSRGFASGMAGGAGGAGANAGAAPRNILEHAAELQMQKLKTKPDPAHHQGHQEPPGVVSRVLGVLVDTAALGVGGFLLFSGYYTLAYPDIGDLDAALKNANRSVELAEEGVAPSQPPAGGAPGASTGGKPGGGAALPPPMSAVEPASFPPLTRAWCQVMDRYLGIRRYVEKSIREFRDPTYHKLLPDMAPELKGRIKTLVLDLDDLLVHKEWTRQYGWKIYKRPGVQDFLLEMGGYYELVIFTDAPATYAEPIISKLDPHRVVLYRLYRPETQYHNGKHVRDLSKLNRDLSQVLMISCNPEAWEFQPENTLKLKPWHHNSSTDTTLLDLIPMLQLIATKGIRDVRDVVRSYDGQEDIPKAFKERMSQVSGQQKQPQKRGILSIGSMGK